MFQAVVSLVKTFLDPSGEQEAPGIVCEQLAWSDGGTSWTAFRVISMEQRTT